MWSKKLLGHHIKLYSTLCMNSEVSTIPRHLDCLQMWNKIKEEQSNLCISPSVEKIKVTYDGILGTSALEMTKGISTPLDCAKHLSEMLVKESVIAMVNNTPWDMNRPLTYDCLLDFVQFKDSHIDPTAANSAFWQSCALLLAATLETAFHCKHNVRVISLPSLNPKNGGFVCDISFNPTHQSFVNWVPSPQELYALNAYIQRMAADDLSFEPLDVSVSSELLQRLFADNPLRSQQITQVFNKHQDSGGELELSPNTNEITERSTLPVYRVGNFVECFTDGPLIRSTNLIGKISISSFYRIGRLRGSSSNIVYRVQGVAIPSAFLTHFTTFHRLVEWSKLPNSGIDALPDYVEPF
uniref:Putative phospholipid-transporting ATPase IF n=1 Tax=Schistosoma japonicum TaxID=6182 RepID=C1LHK0_SCHJA|nr:putative phospholipid-transporting ATPase IF [Schistosoma japonicum]CAX74178.1 putative phospholipid-transporting ATPase IF [Schistosoma japonicum]